MARFDGTNNGEQLFGTGEADLLNGLGGNDQLFGDAGDDIMDGGTGIDTMRGGSGNDFYLVDASGDIIIENAGDGIDTVSSSANFTLSANVENLLLRDNATIGVGNDLDNRIELPAATLTSAPSVSLSGLGGNDTIISGVGADTLDGGAGVDTMSGGGGNDTYIVDNASDVITEAVNAGVDLVRASTSHTLAANVENLEFGPSNGLTGTGNELNNTITNRGGNNNILEGLDGNDTLLDLGAGSNTLRGGNGDDVLNAGFGNDVLDGGAGADLMLGDLGNDTYIVDNVGDIVDEGNGVFAPNPALGGVDLVRVSIDFTLGRNVENLTLEGTALNGTGNELNNTITGNSGNNLLSGLAGNDTLLSEAGDDTLDGGLGADTMQGGSGNDIYVVDDNNDGVIEAANAGIDLMRSSARFTVLANNVENLDVFGSVAFANGNDLDNIINGSTTAGTRINGLGGNDTLNGGDFNDDLNGGNGNDVLNAGGGSDQLTGSTGDVLNGGVGNDVYNVTGTPTINEAVDGGIDEVRASGDFTLGANVENLNLLFGQGINGTGNELNNGISGNGQNNVLRGGAGNDSLGARGIVINNFEQGLVDLGDFGNDRLDGGVGDDNMAGGIGNDTYIVDSVGDVVIETIDTVPDPENGFIFQGGIDTVEASVNFTLGNLVENLTLTGTATTGTGNALRNVLTGNARNNVLDGQAGNDTLLGMAGGDTLRGGTGNDQLTGGRGTDTLTGGEGADSFIFDMGATYQQAAMGNDVIRDFVAGVDQVVLDRTTFGNISRSDFEVVANDSLAATSSGLIVYSEGTGRLFFNQNGSSRGFGSGGAFATLQGVVSLGANDLVIQA
jgi:trimeric autotransporter adhesin